MAHVSVHGSADFLEVGPESLLCSDSDQLRLLHRLPSLVSKLWVVFGEEVCHAVQKLVCQVMESAMKLCVPLRVNSATGDNWMDL